jgi:hypothetical protein
MGSLHRLDNDFVEARGAMHLRNPRLPTGSSPPENLGGTVTSVVRVSAERLST